MLREYMKTRLTAFLTVLVLPGGLFAAECLTAINATADPVEYPDNTGYATIIQADQGQGSINCTDFIGDNGPMRQVVFPDFKVSGGVNGEGLIGTVENPLNWETNDVSDPSTFIKLVFIANNGDGSRCTQFYTKNATAGKLGSGFKTNKISDFVACTEGDPEEIPPEPPTPPTPPDITDAGCPEVFQNAINILGDEWDVMILNGSPKGVAGGEGRSAICIDETLNGGNPGADLPPNRCVNRCIVPDAANDPEWIPLIDPTTGLPPSERQPGGLCTDTRPGFDGRFPIACRVCELSNIVQSDFFEPDLPFCWEQGQDVNNGTFKNPPPDQGNQGWDVNGKFGSTCYLISGKTRSGYPYSYWAPSGCPN